MHYHLGTTEERPPTGRRHRLIGLLFLAIFLGLVGKVWVPYAHALVNATAIKFLPPEWADSYLAASLPSTIDRESGNRLIIKTDSLAIDAPVVEGVSPQELLNGVGHDPASAKPGAMGRTVISGHRFWPHSSPWATVFFSLDRLKVGDYITLKYDGQSYRYRVTESWNVPKNQAVPKLAPTVEPILTIYTCGPTPYSAKNRLGYNAILDQSDRLKEHNERLEGLQQGVLE